MQNSYINTDLFIHLHVQSSFSILESTLRISEIVDWAVDNKMPAIGIADSNNLFGAFEFCEKARSKGIQPIIGARIPVKFNHFYDKNITYNNTEVFSDGYLVLYAKNQIGYNNLSRLISKSYLHRSPQATPMISIDDLVSHNEGIIVLSGGENGPINDCLTSIRHSEAISRILTLLNTFKNRFFIEIQRFSANSYKNSFKLLQIANQHLVPVVASNNPKYCEPQDYKYLEILQKISKDKFLGSSSYHGKENLDGLKPEQPQWGQNLKTTQEMFKLFEDCPQAVYNTAALSKKITFKLNITKPRLPSFNSQSQKNNDKINPEIANISEDEALKVMALNGLDERLKQTGVAKGFKKIDYTKRLEHELNVISNMNFSGYFLIVADFVSWAKNNGIAVGPGRGSGAGSLVAYSLTITDLDPIKYTLFFERFLNPDRLSMPDFDIDFCHDRRDEVIEYIKQKYGKDRVAQIITFGSLQARGVLRDVGRVLNIPRGEIDEICKRIPIIPTSPVTLKQAIQNDSWLSDKKKEYESAQGKDEDIDKKNLFSVALKLEGLHRHASTHAAGIVIADRPIVEISPLYQESASSMPATQFSMKWAEKAGMVKFDFLGLKTVTIIDKAEKLIQKKDKNFNIKNISLKDAKTFNELVKGKTIGVFQMESVGMTEALIKMQADSLEDLIALVALYRPGPMDNIPIYCDRKNNKSKTTYLIPELEPILKETFGVITYQEQVMAIAQIIANFSLGEADLLRRAMGKKNHQEMETQRQRFIEGAKKNGQTEKNAKILFELVAKFASYGFNKSHSAPYALLAYQTAYLKFNYPEIYMATCMNEVKDNPDRLFNLFLEAKKIGCPVLKPDIYKSQVGFAPEDGIIRYGLSAIKQVGIKAAQHIVKNTKGKKFSTIADWAQNISTEFINKQTIDNLATAGVFDSIDTNRDTISVNSQKIIHISQKTRSEIINLSNTDNPKQVANSMPKSSRQARFHFGEEFNQHHLPTPSERWTRDQILNKEFETLGGYFSGHILDDYDFQLVACGINSLSNALLETTKIKDSESKNIDFYGVSFAFKQITPIEGNPRAHIVIMDKLQKQEFIAFNDSLPKIQDASKLGQPVLLRVNARKKHGELRINVIKVVLAKNFLKSRWSTAAIVDIKNEQDIDNFKAALDSIKSKGKSPILLRVFENHGDLIPNHILINKRIEINTTTKVRLRQKTNCKIRYISNNSKDN